MQRNARTEKLIATALSLIVAGCFAGMIALALGGCDAGDEEGVPIPQENSDSDLIPDPDNGNAARVSALTAGEDDEPNPDFAASSHPGISALTSSSFHYDRTKALDYIRRYALTPNPQTAYCMGTDPATREKVPEDCTDFASQVLWYGGLPMAASGSAQSGWWYGFSCSDFGSSRSWRQVNGLVSYLISESHVGEFRQRARDLKIGDLIFYRLRRPETGYRCDVSNLFDHTTVVSGFDANGEPLVAYHSHERLGAPWNANNGSGQSLGEACAIGFVHIKD